MTINNFNNLPKYSAHDLGKGGSASGIGNSTPASGAVTTGANQGAGGGSQLGNTTDWFSQLDSGSALPISATDKFGKNPPLDLIVDSIMESLGLQE